MQKNHFQKEMPTSLFLHKNGKVDTFQKADPLEKLIHFFAICIRCATNIVNVGSGDIRRLPKKGSIRKKIDE